MRATVLVRGSDNYDQLTSGVKVCQTKGCKNTGYLQKHHVNPVRNLKGKNSVIRWAAVTKRKTVTVCQVCYKMLYGAFKKEKPFTTKGGLT